MLHRVERADVASRVRALLNGREVGDGSTGWLERLRARVPLRADPGRRGALAIGVVALVAAVITCWWVFAAGPRAMPVLQRSPAAASMAGSPASNRAATPAAPGAAAPSSAGIVVDVVGKVRRPGLYHLPVAARVADAIAAAGGTVSGFDVSVINLAAHIADGQQIVVGVPPNGGPAGGAVGSASGGGPGAAGPVPLNSATLEQLQTLPGVGPVLAQHILDWRAAHGGFSSVEQLNDVPGIGDVKFAALKTQVTL